MEFEFDPKITQCVNCASENISDFLTDFKGIKIAKCQKCGFQFMNPQYSDSYLTDYYSNYAENEDFDYWHETLLIGHSFYLELIANYVSTGKLYDVGCGNGHLLEAAKNNGWEVRGYDVDASSTLKLSQRLNIEVDSGDFFSCDPGNEYDLVTMHQVLEHLKNPNEYLKKIHSLIKKDGFLFVAVPNINSLSNRLKRVFEIIGVRKGKIAKHYDTNHHVLYFEPKTLKDLLLKHGFETVYQRNCLKVSPDMSKAKLFFQKRIVGFLFPQSAFLVIARKI